ncbi:MAG: serpin family protein [Ruminococcaceae bacterium]|nr:serpin family protein [Oscillospiraceae bacterium]
MNPKDLQDAIGNINDAFIAEAAKTTKLTPKVWLPAATFIACVLLTVLFLPWNTIFSRNDSSVKDPIHVDTAAGVLEDRETTAIDTTDINKDPSKSDTVESTQDVTENTTHADTQNSVDFSDTPDKQITSVILPPSFVFTPTPDTADTDYDRSEESSKEETTAVEDDIVVPLDPDKPNVPVLPPHQDPVILSRPLYPEQEQYFQASSVSQWRSVKDERIKAFKSGIGNIQRFMSLSVREFFSDSGNENLIFSPVNTYISLGMLAETTAQNSRAQLLKLLGENDINSLKSSSKNLWNCCYRDDGIVTALLGNSLWLDNSFTPKTSVTDVLSENYYVSSFAGNMGDEEYDTLLRSWLNEHTKGLLKNTVTNNYLDPYSAISVMSTVYFKADWSSAFSKKNTVDGVFHSPNGDITAKFMRKEHTEILYSGENFSATRLKFKEGGAMWFILPDEDVSLQSLFSDAEVMDFITGKAHEKSGSLCKARIRFGLPKFDITTETDLEKDLKNLGITDVFDPLRADFSSLTDEQIYVKDLNQAVRVRIDEYGCEAAAVNVNDNEWTGGYGSAGSAQVVDLTLNRPFIFVVTSDAGLPLFVGTVNRPK